MARRTGRQRNQLPNCYYEGYLEKRSFKDKTSRKLWSCLCGTAIFFYNDLKDSDYVEKLDLSEMISVTDDNSQDRNLNAARFTICGKDGNTKFTAPNPEARELWKGFILSVTQLSVPSHLALLPGQLTDLQGTIEKEIERRQTCNQPAPNQPAPNQPTPNPGVSSVPEVHLPPCYHSVSRLEAELLLEKENKRGNMLLRPGSNNNTYAISTRQEGHNGAVFKHYRVTHRVNGGFDIALENPVSCATLQEVINYLVERTERVMVPLLMEEEYEQSISFIHSDKENGEKSIQRALPHLPREPVRIEKVIKEEEEEKGEVVKEEEEVKEKAPADATLPRTTPIPAPRRLSASTATLPPEGRGASDKIPVPAPRKQSIAPSTLPPAAVPEKVTDSVGNEKVMVEEDKEEKERVPTAATPSEFVSELKKTLAARVKAQQ